MQGTHPPPPGLRLTGSPFNDAGEEIKRLFVPAYSSMHDTVPEVELITYTAEKQYRQPQCLHPFSGAVKVEWVTMVVSIAGACRDSGKPTAQASWGVYFGPGSRYNSSGRLSPSCPQTRSRAEIEALSQAFDTISTIRGLLPYKDITVRRVIFCADSEYLCQAMSMKIEGWIKDGGVGPDGQPVAHFDKLKQIHERLEALTTPYCDGELWSQFWHVPKEKNREADELANGALDG